MKPTMEQDITYTQYKLEDICRSINMRSTQSMATINSGSERQARKDAANLRAATYACGAYLASSRRDLTYDDIYSILRAAGGITPDRKAMYAHLDKWRVNHGYERDERK